MAQQNTQLLGAAQNAGGQITDDASRTASVDAFGQELTLVLAKIKDNSLAQPLTQQVGDAQQKSEDGDPAGAERDLLALWSAVQNAYQTDMAARYTKVVNKIRAIADQKIWPQGVSKVLEMRGLGANETAIANGETIEKIEQFLGSGKNLYKQLKAALDDPNPPVPQPNAPQHPQVDDDDSDQQIDPVDQGEDAFQDEEQEDGDTDQEDDDNDQAQPLAAFDWRESSARNVVQLAISQGLLAAVRIRA